MSSAMRRIMFKGKREGPGKGEGSYCTRPALALHALGREITLAQATNANADLKAAGLDTWAKVFHWLVNDERPLTTTAPWKQGRTRRSTAP